MTSEVGSTLGLFVKQFIESIEMAQGVQSATKEIKRLQTKMSINLTLCTVV